MFEYLKNKNSRRRGLAIELAIFVIVLCSALSIITVSISMIHKNNLNSIVQNTSQKLELNRIGAEFCSAVKKDELAFFSWKLSVETEYLNSDKYSCEIKQIENLKSLEISAKNNDEYVTILYVELTALENGTYKISDWRYNTSEVEKIIIENE